MLKLKICGVNDAGNFQSLSKIDPDFIGLNFYKKSPRYTGNNTGFTKTSSTALIGIFVDDDPATIIEIFRKYQLDYVQLHGQESQIACKELKAHDLKIIKAFAINEDFNFSILEGYMSSCDYFLFDAAGPAPGGNGRSFNWQILEYYPYNKPFFLAGGLSPENIHEVLNLQLPQLFALDVNSGYEERPGVKNIDKIKELTELIKNNDR